MLHYKSALLRCVVAVGLGFASQVGAQSVETLAAGLNNPRGIGFAPNGELYVVEMGSGGAGPCIPSPVFPNPPRCYGESGALTLIAPGGVPGFQRVATGLPSLGLATGAASGSNGWPGNVSPSITGAKPVAVPWRSLTLSAASEMSLGCTSWIRSSALTEMPSSSRMPDVSRVASSCVFRPGTSHLPSSVGR